MKKLTQKQIVKNELLKTGIIRRNWCLSQFPAITRLGAIAKTLQEEGFVLEGRYSKDKSDYGYLLKSSPYKTITRTLSNGQQITSITK